MIALVIPPLVYRPDGRGLHDIVAGSATVDLADLALDHGARRPTLTGRLDGIGRPPAG